MKFGVRNQLKAEVVEIKKGDVMCQVQVKVEGTNSLMSSVMTMESLQNLGLQKGDQVGVMAKAVNVILTKE